jgi:hypothetical protein
MQTRSRGDYTIANRELVAEGADLRVQVLSLAAGQCVPWHYHRQGSALPDDTQGHRVRAGMLQTGSQG